ncbi:MAG: amino acid/peptide transporter [Phenylobacterium sp.]|nr:amino acid/peptide transporter [Phenylobacterium sp.]
MTAISVRESAMHADRSFLGHPKGLAFLSITEGFERFSYYGMIALLVLYMTGQLLTPGHVEHVAGLSVVRPILERIYGGGAHFSNTQLASAIYAVYSSTVYLTPLIGGVIADRVGRTGTIIVGASVMALGHFLMAFDASFLLALVCLMIGAGCLKGNIATQVGALYAAGDTRRADGFQIFYLGINGGVIFGPMITGWLGQGIAWHLGFGAAGVAMVIALMIYLAGRKHLPPDPPRGAVARAAAKVDAPPMSGREWGALILLVCLLPVLALSIVGNNQIYNSYLVWAQANADLHFLGIRILTSQMLSVDSIVSVITLIGMVVFWRVWKTRFPEPDELGKIAIGCFFGAVGVACLAAGSALTPAGQKVSFHWLLAFHLLNDIGFANVLPVGLALFSRAAPKQMAGLVIGIYYLHLWAGNNLVGYLGTLYEKMTPVQFWLLHAGLVGGAGVAFVVIRLLFGRLLLPGQPAEPDYVLADAQKTP